MSETLKLANSPIVWILSLLIVSIVIIQTFIFFNLARKYVKETNILTKEEVKRSFQVGMIGTIGPAIAVFAVAVALIASIGGPITLSRIGVIGSATIELIAASIGSSGTVGTEGFSKVFLSSASWIMTIGGAGWLISIFFITKKINLIQEKAASKNKLLLPYIATFTPMMLFIVLVINETKKGASEGSNASGFAIFISALIMFSLNKIASNNDNLKWLKEWSMGFSVVGAMIVGTILR